MWDAWAAGDRRGARAAVPDEVVDALVVHGRPERCRAQVRRYADAGVTPRCSRCCPRPSYRRRAALPPDRPLDAFRHLGAPS